MSDQIFSPCCIVLIFFQHLITFDCGAETGPNHYVQKSSDFNVQPLDFSGRLSNHGP